jgi:hypothetical protein
MLTTFLLMVGSFAAGCVVGPLIIKLVANAKV